MQEVIMEQKKIFGWGKYEFGLVMWFFFSWGFVFLDRLTISYLAPLVMGEFELSTTQYGLIGTATTGCYAIAAIVFPMLSDKSGTRKKWLMPFIFGAAIFSAAGAVCTGFGSLIVTRALVGFCEGPIVPLMFAMVVKESSPTKIALNPGIINMGVAVIAVTIGPIFTTQIAIATNWRMAFLLASIPTFVLALFMLKFVREVRVEPTLNAKGEKDGIFAALGKLLRYRNVVVCFILGLLLMSGYWTLMLYATLFFSTVGGRDLSSAGFIVGMMGVLCIVWTIVVPKLSDFIGRKPAMIVWFLLCACGPFVMFGAPESFAAALVYGLVGGIPGSIFPFCQAIIPGETLPPNLVATASGLITGVSEFIGGSAWPALSGVIADSQGLGVTILVAGIAFVIAAVVALGLKETRVKKDKAATPAAPAAPAE
jgi:predicted MFS family arabinose efflux permease